MISTIQHFEKGKRLMSTCIYVCIHINMHIYIHTYMVLNYGGEKDESVEQRKSLGQKNLSAWSYIGRSRLLHICANLQSIPHKEWALVSALSFWMMMCQYRSISCNKCTNPAGMLVTGASVHVQWQGIYAKLQFLPIRFAMNLKLL